MQVYKSVLLTVVHSVGGPVTVSSPQSGGVFTSSRGVGPLLLCCNDLAVADRFKSFSQANCWTAAVHAGSPSVKSPLDALFLSLMPADKRKYINDLDLPPSYKNIREMLWKFE